MKKAVIYARYSSEKQTEQSIEGQLTVCQKFARDNDFLVVEEYIDRATTGTNDNRAAFQAMIRDSAKQEWQFVIVYKGDRFSRNRIESAIHKKTLRDNGVKLVSATENIPDSPEGIILESLLEGMAEYYSAELSQKVKRGLNESKKKKQFTGGRIPFGYDIVDKKPIPNVSEASTVLRVHTMYSEGMNARDIKEILQSEAIRDKRGNTLDMSDIYRILRLSIYTDHDIYPTIVPKEIKNKVYSIIEVNKRAPARAKGSSKYLLSGKLICGECGGLMTAETGTSCSGTVHHYYKCFEKKKHTRKCTMPSIRKDEIEDKVFSVCCEVMSNGFIPLVVDAAYKIHEDDLKANLTIINLESELSEKQKALNNLVTAIEQGIFSSTTKQRLTELEEQIESIKYRLACEKSRAESGLSKEDYYAFFADFIGKQHYNESFKQEVIDMLVRQVVVFEDKLCITFNYSPDKSRGKRRDYEIKLSELAEAQSEYASGIECSNLLTLTPPKANNLNSITFIKLDYWGVWIANRKR
jgi:DNA invertase Pin-like site-specific DNA recombinase